MKVAVYWNLHKKCWSIQSREGEDYGKLFDHAETVRLQHCQFKVSEAGRQRVLRENRKNVHAFVVGELVTYDTTDGRRVSFGNYSPLRDNLRMVHVSYNPRVSRNFFTDNGMPIRSASEVFMGEHRLVQAWVNKSCLHVTI